MSNLLFYVFSIFSPDNLLDCLPGLVVHRRTLALADGVEADDVNIASWLPR